METKTKTRQRHVTAGPAALSEMARLLGLSGGWTLEGFCGLAGESVRLDLRKDAHRAAFTAAPAEGGLALRAEGGGEAAARLALALQARLKGRRLPDLLAMLDADPLSFAEELEPGREGDAVRVPCLGQPLDLLDDGWRNFYADQDFEVLLGVPEVLPQGIVFIEYSDMECFYARPKRSFRKWTFLDWPEVGRDESRRHDSHVASVTIELEEKDMIMGTGERADLLVSEARRLSSEGDALVIHHRCTPIVMGEDFSGLARRCETECKGKAVRWSQKDRDTGDNFGSHMRDLFERPGFFDGPGDPDRVNLFHFPPELREAELAPMLRELGLEPDVCVFPEVDFPALERLGRARWQVVCRRGSYPTKLRELLAGRPRTLVDVPAPYGVEATRRCLAAVAQASGRDERFEAAWAARMEAFRPRWDELRSRAAAHRLGFVVSEATLPRLMELRYGHGAPLAEMALEMGFGIDLIYFDRHGAPPRLPAGLEGARVSVFRAPWQLESALREASCQAVYSDIVFDRRLGRAGKARFSSRDFEMGLGGARRTLERLLDACGLEFYRRYADHLPGRPS